MRINIFEGARRIAYVVAGVWALGALVGNLIDEPRATLRYAVVSPSFPPVRADVGCGAYDLAKWDYWRTTEEGTRFNVQVCFRASTFEGKQLIPYKADDKMVWGADKHSSLVSEYATRRMEQLAFTSADLDWVDGQFWPMKFEQLKKAVAWLLGGWIFLWIFAVCVGWIVRGFAGIPRGQDRKSASTSVPD